MTIDVYRQYFLAEANVNGVQRRAALVTLTSDSCDGEIGYTVGATFFPHEDESDFSVSYDAVVSREVFHAKGRRSKKREASLLEEFHGVVDELSFGIGARVFWDKPLRDAERG